MTSKCTNIFLLGYRSFYILIVFPTLLLYFVIIRRMKQTYLLTKLDYQLTKEGMPEDLRKEVKKDYKTFLSIMSVRSLLKTSREMRLKDDL